MALLPLPFRVPDRPGGLVQPEDVGEGRRALHLLVEEAAVQADAQEVEQGWNNG